MDFNYRKLQCTCTCTMYVHVHVLCVVVSIQTAVDFLKTYWIHDHQSLLPTLSLFLSWDYWVRN